MSKVLREDFLRGLKLYILPRVLSSMSCNLVAHKIICYENRKPNPHKDSWRTIVGEYFEIMNQNIAGAGVDPPLFVSL